MLLPLILPEGCFILAFLVLVIGGSLLLYAFKGGQVNKSRARHELFSRETLLLWAITSYLPLLCWWCC
ncbi:cytochrome c-type biogenesis CcmF C-terminal domain-containing protein [Budvicia aquatica]|uniref:cytochrome c-type biogenesis CcmF C-terminal domain-containing protein n=1 Tax=Budvicia aquatica TaxID=82979 RepID=UPI002101602A|nr:cytochrome c-type biogenesis CcmF C-terminal domain-containing protein [Budvicia aquatica]